MDELKNKLKKVLENHHLFGIIYSDIEGKKIIKTGELNSLPDDGLINSLFANEFEVKRLYDSLKGQILPTGWGQGEVRCYIDITSNKIIFGVFVVVKKENVVENYHQSKIFCKEVKEILEGHTFEQNT